MSITKQLLPGSLSLKFTPATPGVNWTRIETLVHGPGAGDTARAGGDFNSAVFACLMAICTAVPEAPLMVYERDGDGKEEPLPDHPLKRLIDIPTPEGELNTEEILFWTAWALHTDGNAYWIKVRAGNEDTGNVVEYWPMSPTLMKPVTERDKRGAAQEFISYYEMQVAPSKYERVGVHNVIHFRNGIDDRDMRLGLSPLKRLVRQIASDDEADRYTETLLKNYAVPGLVVIPASGGFIDESNAARIAESFDRKFKNEKRGSTAVLSKEASIHQFGFSPVEMDLGVMHRIPEERIAAVMGVPAIIAGLGAGLERSTYSNFREAREMFTEQKLVPLWRSLAAKLNTSLLPDFTDDLSMFVHFDLTGVRALQEDEDRKYARLNIGVQGMRPWITVNEARSEVGLPPVDGGDELTQAQPPPLFGADDRREEDEESGDEEDTQREETSQFDRYMEKLLQGGAKNGHDAPFPVDWKSYP